MKTARELLAEAKKVVPEVEVEEARRLLGGAAPPALVDVRETPEWQAGRLPGALHVPRGFLEMQIEKAVPDRSRPILCYCGSGIRSLLAGKTLKEMGYSDVRSMAGGIVMWEDAGYETVR